VVEDGNSYFFQSAGGEGRKERELGIPEKESNHRRTPSKRSEGRRASEGNIN